MHDTLLREETITLNVAYPDNASRVHAPAHRHHASYTSIMR
jgi:hypothetical protein